MHRAGDVVCGPVPHLLGQHDRQCRSGQRSERPARRCHLAAVGRQRLRPDLCKLHARRWDAGRSARPQADHARRRRRLQYRIGHRSPRGQRRLVDRGAGHHGNRRRGQRARNPFDHPPRLPRPEDAGGCPRGLGRGLWAGSGARSSYRRCLGGILQLESHLLVQPRLRRRRVRDGGDSGARVFGPPGAAVRRARVRLRGRFLGLSVLRRHPGGGVRLRSRLDRCPLRAVWCLWHRVRGNRASGQVADARPFVVPTAAFHRVELRCVRRILRDVLNLLLHRVVSAGRGQRIGLSDGDRLSAHGGRTDHRLRAHRPAGGPHRCRVGP